MEPYTLRSQAPMFKSGIELNSAVLAAVMASSNVTDSNRARNVFEKEKDHSVPFLYQHVRLLSACKTG